MKRLLLAAAFAASLCLPVHAQDAGSPEALQAAQGVGATTGQQLQSLETIQLAMAQAQGAHILADADRRAMEDKALDFFIHDAPVPMTGYKGF